MTGEQRYLSFEFVNITCFSNSKQEILQGAQCSESSSSIKNNKSGSIAQFVLIDKYWHNQFAFWRILSKSFSQFIMSIFIFSILFNRFCPVKKCGVTPHCLYRDSFTLSMRRKLSWNFKNLKIFDMRQFYKYEMFPQ